jgi:hypothetical protein
MERKFLMLFSLMAQMIADVLMNPLLLGGGGQWFLYMFFTNDTKVFF